MFNNIGRKIKGLARFFCLIGIIVSVVIGICLISVGAEARYGGDSQIILGIVVAIVGSLLSWISAFVLYGFGQLVENSDIQTEIVARQALEDKDK